MTTPEQNTLNYASKLNKLHKNSLNYKEIARAYLILIRKELDKIEKSIDK